METRTPVTAYMIEYACDTCGAKMVPDGEVVMTYPPLYQHRCPNCGEVRKFPVQYPHVSYASEMGGNE